MLVRLYLHEYEDFQLGCRFPYFHLFHIFADMLSAGAPERGEGGSTWSDNCVQDEFICSTLYGIISINILNPGIDLLYRITYYLLLQASSSSWLRASSSSVLQRVFISSR